MVMSDKSNFTRLRAIATVNSVLKDNIEFKIGKTSDWERRKCEYQTEGYTNFHIIAECSTLEEVDKLETYLIDFFRNYSTCKNENDGGGGKTSESDVYYIYLATK